MRLHITPQGRDPICRQDLMAAIYQRTAAFTQKKTPGKLAEGTFRAG